MPKAGKQFSELEKAADKIEPHMERATLRAFERIRARVDVNMLANAISAGNVRWAMRVLMSAADMGEIFEPVGRVSADAFSRGVRLGVEELKRL